ncbi:hypothetical protein CDD83_9303 [Cordyceps sp. RAO-2017]|nr:hypothetical protein CDD83_9303 [Cordyceps sp. RAO-2017]
MKVFIADRDAEALRKAKSELGQEVATSVTDVSKPESWKTLKNTVLEAFGSVELLVLNAGMSAKGGWGDDGYFRQILETNLFGIVNGLNTFLPVVQDAAKSKPTAIVITGSKQGITNPPGNPAYNASKAAVKSLAEHLSWDLKDQKTTVHLLVPGWTFTGLVADFLHKKMGENKFYVICPDNDVSEEKDKKRMLWSVGDIVKERPPLSRWRDEWKKEAEETMAKTQV